MKFGHYTASISFHYTASTSFHHTASTIQQQDEDKEADLVLAVAD